MNHTQMMEAQADALDLRDSILRDLGDCVPELTALNQRMLATGRLSPADEREEEAVCQAVRMALAMVGLDLCRQQIAEAQKGN